MKKILIFVLFLQHNIMAKSNTEQVGDVLSLLIPTVAFGSTYLVDDADGRMEFLKAYGSTALATQILKYTVRAPRPNNPNSITSFPSGHTSSAFSGASFIHKRYGLRYALPAYAGAIYTAYSRVHAKKHYTKDVIAGALLGMGFSYYFVSPYKNLHIEPSIGDKTYGLQFNYTW